MSIVEQVMEMKKVMNECCNIYDEQGNHLGNKCFNCEYWCDTNYVCCSYNEKEATALYNAGYRKASDVAREIFEEIEKLLKKNELRNYEPYNVESYYSGDLEKALDELKKKYTESEKDK